jgi:mannose-6-phosphate isomerase-like protein (cupin superfamily)
LLKIDNWHDRHCPEKSWGQEEWIVNNDLYCGKKLHFKVAGGQTSLHFHMRKHETMYVEQGIFHIYVVNQGSVKPELHTLGPGNSLVIEPGAIHRIKCATEAGVLIEFSTHHEDSDSYRVER